MISEAHAINVDIGNPQTIGKHGVAIYNGSSEGSQIAYRYDTSSALTIDAVGFFRYANYGTGGTYSLKLVLDNSGLPGTTVLAENISFGSTGINWGRQTVVLNQPVDLDPNSKYWIIYNGGLATSTDYIEFSVIDNHDEIEGIQGIDYHRWQVAKWNGTAWNTPFLKLNAYPVYGVAWVYNDGEIVGDGQFACRENTANIWGIYVEGNKIYNAPSVAYDINYVQARLSPYGSPAQLYYVVSNFAGDELANISVSPSPVNWSKTTYTFETPLHIPAGNNEINAYFKSPLSNSSNYIRARAIEYVDETHSYPDTARYSKGSTENPALKMDGMLNMSVSYGPVNFVSSRSSGIRPLTVRFTDTSELQSTSWAWDFENDGNIDSYVESPIHIYGKAGNYTVNLTVTNGNGTFSEVKTDYITVSEQAAPVSMDQIWAILKHFFFGLIAQGVAA